MWSFVDSFEVAKKRPFNELTIPHCKITSIVKKGKLLLHEYVDWENRIIKIFFLFFINQNNAFPRVWNEWK